MVLKLRGPKKPGRLAISSYALVEVFINAIGIIAELRKREVNVDL